MKLKNIEERNGDWIQTSSGIKFYPFDVKTEEIKINDIIHALSFLCRFIGHCNNFYSVAQHSVLVASMCEDRYKLQGLLHDSAEAYISDIAHPIKKNIMYDPIRDLEKNILDKIYNKFGVINNIESDSYIKEVDKRMLFTEKISLMKPGIYWGGENVYKPFDITIEPWTPERAQLEFHKMFNELFF